MGAGKSYSAQTLPYLTSSLQKPLEEILFVSLLEMGNIKIVSRVKMKS